MRIIKLPSQTLILFLSLILIFSMGISGCKPAPTWTPLATITPLPTSTFTMVPPSMTPTPEVINSAITLPDGSMIIVKPQTDVKVLSQPGVPAGATEVQLQINRGEIMVIPNPDSGNWLTVISSKYYVARSQGCAMVVKFDDLADAFEMKCIGGTCEAGSDIDHLSPVPTNMVWAFQRGNYLKLADIDFSQISEEFADHLPICLAAAMNEGIPVTGGETPTPEVDLGATATAACADFHSRFPATPCP